MQQHRCVTAAYKCETVAAAAAAGLPAIIRAPVLAVCAGGCCAPSVAASNAASWGQGGFVWCARVACDACLVVKQTRAWGGMSLHSKQLWMLGLPATGWVH